MSPNTVAHTQAEVARLAARHALGWLVAANAVGVLLAALLLRPGLNVGLGAFTFGRWVPLHLDWQLYGWCALPLVAALLAWCFDPRHPQAIGHARLALGAWSLALVLGGVSWLGGSSSGKPFLEWSGWARPVLPWAMAALWSILAAHTWWRRAELGRGELQARWLVLAALAVVPALLHWSMGREVYPRVNPDSGGATGSRLLASTLGIVVIYGFLGETLRIARAPARRWYWGYFGFSTMVCVGIERGNTSHHDWAQVLGLATLLGWLPLAWIYLGNGTGRAEAKRWWGAAFGWWAALVASGIWTFLPGISERLKYTNAMVGHAHLAMAGLVTSANMAVLIELRGVGATRGYWFWQAACALHVAVLVALGFVETGHTADLYLGTPWTQAIYAVRLGTGAVMLLVAVWWWRDAGGEKGARSGR